MSLRLSGRWEEGAQSAEGYRVMGEGWWLSAWWDCWVTGGGDDRGDEGVRTLRAA